MALSIRGVFLAGDNQVKNDAFVSHPENVDIFQKDFMNHPKSSWLANTSIFRQKQECNLNLVGCLFRSIQAITK